MLLIIEIN